MVGSIHRLESGCEQKCITIGTGVVETESDYIHERVCAHR